MFAYIWCWFGSSKKSIVDDPKIREVMQICEDICEQLEIVYDEKKCITLCDGILALLDEYVKFHKLDTGSYESLKSIIIYTCLIIDIMRGHPPENIKKIEELLKNNVPMIYHDIIWILQNINEKIEHNNFHINNVLNLIKQHHKIQNS